MAFWWTKYDEAGNHMGLHLLRQTSRESPLVISIMRRSATTISVMKHGRLENLDVCLAFC